MPVQPRILAFSGSLSANSYNTKYVRAATAGATAAGADVTFIELRDLPLPLYDADLEAADGIPDNALELKKLFKTHHAFLIASPEYNSSVSGALKNVIDWVSRPHPDEKPLECFRGKVATLIAASPGALGGLRGLVHLRAILGNIGVIVLPDQRALSKAHEAFDTDGKLTDAKEREAVEALAANLANTTTKVLG